MPVRKRSNKRRGGAEVWDAALLTGFDCLRQLEAAGIAVDADLNFDRDEARAAWQRHGDELLANWPADAQSWALAEFGLPVGG